MIRNTAISYGSVAKWLHWLTALWVLAAYLLALYLNYVIHNEGPQRSPVIQLHKGIGFSVLMFFALRIWWRVKNPAPKLPESMPNWQIKASHASHFCLYALLIAMPLSGYFGNGSGVDYKIFAIPAFQYTAFGIWIMDLLGVTYEQWEIPFDFFHYRIAGPFLFWMIVAVHAGAGLYHHFVEKDDVLKRMLPSKSD